MFSLPGRLPRTARSPDAREIHWTTIPDSRRRIGDASPRHGKSYRRIAKHTGHRLLQHHEMLHEGLPGEHSNHGQRNYSLERTRGGRLLRSAGMVLARTEEIARSLR